MLSFLKDLYITKCLHTYIFLHGKWQEMKMLLKSSSWFLSRKLSPTIFTTHCWSIKPQPQFIIQCVLKVNFQVDESVLCTIALLVHKNAES